MISVPGCRAPMIPATAEQMHRAKGPYFAKFEGLVGARKEGRWEGDTERQRQRQRQDRELRRGWEGKRKKGAEGRRAMARSGGNRD